MPTVSFLAALTPASPAAAPWATAWELGRCRAASGRHWGLTSSRADARTPSEPRTRRRSFGPEVAERSRKWSGPDPLPQPPARHLDIAASRREGCKGSRVHREAQLPGLWFLRQPMPDKVESRALQSRTSSRCPGNAAVGTNVSRDWPVLLESPRPALTFDWLRVSGAGPPVLEARPRGARRKSTDSQSRDERYQGRDEWRPTTDEDRAASWTLNTGRREGMGSSDRNPLLPPPTNPSWLRSSRVNQSG